MERNLRRTVEGWRKEGMTDAARHLEHFLDGSSEPITYNRDQARSFSPVRSAEEDAQAQIRAELLERARGLEDGEKRDVELDVTGSHGTIDHGLGVVRGFLGDTDRFDDNLATGRTRIRSGYKGTLRRSGNAISVDGVVEHSWKDTYDFHSPEPGADAAKSLARYRGARSYGFGGDWRQRLDGTIERRRERLLPDFSFTDLH
jgi:hypothetical protein